MLPEGPGMSVRALCIAVLFMLGAACGGGAGSGAAAPNPRPAVVPLAIAQLAIAQLAATPSPQASVDPCASALPDLPNDLPTAFAYDLESEDVLRFIAALGAVPEREQKRVFDTAVGAADSAQERTALTAIAAACPGLDEIYGTSRAMYLVVNQWTLGELANAKRFGAFSAVVGSAVAVLARGDDVPAGARQGALAAFPDLPGFSPSAPLEASAAPSPGACAQPDSPPKAIHLIKPIIPDVANSAGTTGDVAVKIELSWTGAIQSVKLFSDTLHNRPGFQGLMKATILAFAASTYAPAIEACVPVGSELDFTMSYGFK